MEFDVGIVMPLINHATSVPVMVDAGKCIADKGCRVCVDVCPLDVLAIDEAKGVAYMQYDEWVLAEHEGAARALAQALDDPAHSVRVAVAEALADRKDPNISQELIALC